MTSSQSHTVYFQAQQDGEHLFGFTFFGSGSGDFSGSLDTFKLMSNTVDTSSRYTDIYYDAHWVRLMKVVVRGLPHHSLQENITTNRSTKQPMT